MRVLLFRCDLHFDFHVHDSLGLQLRDGPPVLLPNQKRSSRPLRQVSQNSKHPFRQQTNQLFFVVVTWFECFDDRDGHPLVLDNVKRLAKATTQEPTELGLLLQDPRLHPCPLIYQHCD